MKDKPLPPQEIREVVAREILRTKVGFPISDEYWASITETDRQYCLAHADRALIELSKPPYNVVRLAEPLRHVDASHKDKYYKVVSIVDGTVKEE